MTRSVLALFAVAAALVIAAPAQAAAPSAVPSAVPSQAAEPLAVSSITPARGAFVPPTPTGGIPWGLTAAGLPADAQVLVTITDNPATGPDGALLDANRVDFFFVTADEATPTRYTGKSDPGPNAWSANVGTYYWQARATWTDASGVFHSAASVVENVKIGTAPPGGANPAPGQGGQGGQAGSPAGVRDTLAMSSLDARYYVRTVIRRHTKRRPTNLRYACGKVNSRAFRCRPTWRDSKNVYTAGLVTFTHSRSTGGRVLARGTFTGRRSSRRCARRRSVKSCAVRFRWRTSTASRPIPAAARAR